MSGGSYNYLCNKDDLADLAMAQDDITAMADRLAALGYAEDAARATVELLLSVRQATVWIETQAKALRGIWEAVEWWDSCDWPESEVKKALADYRGIARSLPDCTDCQGTGYRNRRTQAENHADPGLPFRFHGCQNPNCAGGKDVSGVSVGRDEV